MHDSEEILDPKHSWKHDYKILWSISDGLYLTINILNKAGNHSAMKSAWFFLKEFFRVVPVISTYYAIDRYLISISNA